MDRKHAWRWVLRQRALIIAAICIKSAVLYAQAPTPEPRMIPVEVARAGLGPLGAMMGTVTYAVGRTPIGWPSALVPAAPATVVGGAAAREFSSVLVSYPATAADARARVRTLLTQAGWREGHHRQRVMMTLDEQRRPPMWCNGNEFLDFVVVDSTTRSTTIKVDLINASSGAYSQDCRDGDEVRSFRVGPAVQPPVLVEPPGIPKAVGSIELSSNGDATTHASLVTTAAPAELLPHYAGQLTADGWTASPAAVAADVAVQIFYKTIGDKRFRGTLLIVTNSATRDFTFQFVGVR